MKIGRYFGIDFGTTNTSVVCINKDEYGEKYDYYEEETGLPFSSIVAIPKDGKKKILFGREVKKKRLELSQDYEIIPSMKSYLGTDKAFCVEDRKYSATDITEAYLNYLKEYIINKYSVKIDEAIFAVPVDFKPSARRELKEAATNAGIKVKGFITESTAAYIANKNNTSAFSRVMVIDWGGGTLDISILELKGSCIYERSVYGEAIGGDDIDLEMAKSVHSKLIRQTGTMINFDEMSNVQKDAVITRCEIAKIAFTEDDATDILLREYGEFGTKTVSLDYEYFEEIVKPIIKESVLKAINTAMERGKVSKAGIDAVIIVGGSSKLRPFEKAMCNIFGEDKIIRSSKKDWTVAVGAAYIDIIGSEYYLNDTVGVLLSDDTVYPILRKNTDRIGKVIPPISFSLTEDAPCANFIFTNEDKSVTYHKTHVMTKGFLKEKLELSASIGDDQIAELKITNQYMGEDYFEIIEINQLKFYYDLSEIKEL